MTTLPKNQQSSNQHHLSRCWWSLRNGQAPVLLVAALGFVCSGLLVFLRRIFPFDKIKFLSIFFADGVFTTKKHLNYQQQGPARLVAVSLLPPSIRIKNLVILCASMLLFFLSACVQQNVHPSDSHTVPRSVMQPQHDSQSQSEVTRTESGDFRSPRPRSQSVPLAANHDRITQTQANTSNAAGIQLASQQDDDNFQHTVSSRRPIRSQQTKRNSSPGSDTRRRVSLLDSEEPREAAAEDLSSDSDRFSPNSDIRAVNRFPLTGFRSFQIYGSQADRIQDQRSQSDITTKAGAELNAIVVSGDGNRACFGGSDGSVFCASIITSNSVKKQGSREQLEVRRVYVSPRPVLAISLAPNERYLAIAKFGVVSILDLNTDEIIAELTRVGGRLQTVAWDPRGELLAIGRASGEIFVWRVFEGRNAGQDSLNAVERYGSPKSPITHLTFHPSGRAFFAVQQSGIVSMWRLLRTEAELGLLDKQAVVDRDRGGSRELTVGRVPSLVTDIFADSTKEILYVAAADGSVYRWRIRGLRRQESMFLGVDSTASVDRLFVQTPERQVKILAASGRGQKVSFWCSELPEDVVSDDTRRVPIIDPVKDEEELNGLFEPQVIDGRLEYAEDSGERNRAAAISKPAEQKRESAYIAASAAFHNAIGMLRAGSQSQRIWLTQKGGRVLTADVGSLLADARFRRRLNACVS